MEEDSRQATGSHVKQMLHQGLYKKAVSWRRIPANLSRWFVGVGRSAHQMTPYPGIDFFLFFLLFFGLAYSGDLGHGQGTRACIRGAQAGWWEALGKNPTRDEDNPPYRSVESAGHNCCILWGQWRRGFTTAPASSVSVIGDPGCPVKHLESWHWRAPKWPDGSVWYGLDDYEVVWLNDGLSGAVIILKTIAEETKNVCLLRQRYPVYIRF